MPDIKLFRLSPAGMAELPGQSAQVEKSPRTLFEKNLEVLLGMRLLASEYSTAKVHRGRIPVASSGGPGGRGGLDGTRPLLFTLDQRTPWKTTLSP